ncbi:hypothetical protein PR202_ga23782 [Eleusine coracana subsp. coracana]|uniref:Uncharacterized protein n=1 Tax=Eleusine coracana subsp. coracana TaxID=191504 RepID=A0AAV5D734_ELECO|nr:hypothetical protein PR202_ga23782 [Eleusine coracana subsp. coracana]
MTVGLGLLLDLASRVPRGGASSATAHSYGALSAAATAAAAAALSTTGVPLSARHLFGFPGFTIAHCDAGATAGWNSSPDLINDLNNKIHGSIQYARKDDFDFPPKEYPSELKPLFSAFGLKNFSVLTLRSFLLYYLPLIQPQPHTHDDDEDDDDMLQDDQEEKPVDLITPFYSSVKQIIHASKSAKRKAARGMSTPEFTYCVARTTFRAQALGVAAAWVVQSIIEVYRCFIRKPRDDEESFEEVDKLRKFGGKILGITIKGCFSLVLASIGAGIGALVHPGHGQWFDVTHGKMMVTRRDTHASGTGPAKKNQHNTLVSSAMDVIMPPAADPIPAVGRDSSSVGMPATSSTDRDAHPAQRVSSTRG